MDGHFTLPRTSRRVFLQHANVKMMRDVDTQKPAGCRQRYMMYYTVFRMCGEGICGMVWGEEGEGTRGGEGDMNHSSHAGNKVHFLSRQTISQPLQDVAGAS